jgi:hypothetical protein
VRRCQNYQFFGKQSHVPAHSLITIPPSWPFACWSLDMIGPFTMAPGGFTHVLVAIDKFTKWIEYKPIAKLTPDQVVDFISDILHRFGFLMMDAYVQEVRKLEKQVFRPGGSSCATGAQCWCRYFVQAGVNSCSGSTGSFCPGAQAVIHQVFSVGNHRRGSPTTRSRGYGAGGGLARGFYRFHLRSKATSGN